MHSMENLFQVKIMTPAIVEPIAAEYYLKLELVEISLANLFFMITFIQTLFPSLSKRIYGKRHLLGYTVKNNRQLCYVRRENKLNHL